MGHLRRDGMRAGALDSFNQDIGAWDDGATSDKSGSAYVRRTSATGLDDDVDLYKMFRDTPPRHGGAVQVDNHAPHGLPRRISHACPDCVAAPTPVQVPCRRRCLRLCRATESSAEFYQNHVSAYGVSYHRRATSPQARRWSRRHQRLVPLPTPALTISSPRAASRRRRRALQSVARAPRQRRLWRLGTC